MQPDKIIHIFDMDDTLVKTPAIEDVFKVKGGKAYSGDCVIDKAINKMLELSMKALNSPSDEKRKMQQLAGLKSKIYFKKGSDGFIYLFKNNTPASLDFVHDINSSSLTEKEKKTILDKLEFKNNKLVLKLFSEFFQTESTVGTEIIKKVVEKYESVKNKMIVTGRTKGVLNGVAYVLFNIIGLSRPNYGLYLYTNSKGGIPEFKANVIIDSIEKNNWEEIHLYEDRKKWLDFIEKQVGKLFPKVKFHKHHIIS